MRLRECLATSHLIVAATLTVVNFSPPVRGRNVDGARYPRLVDDLKGNKEILRSTCEYARCSVFIGELAATWRAYGSWTKYVGGSTFLHCISVGIEHAIVNPKFRNVSEVLAAGSRGYRCHKIT